MAADRVASTPPRAMCRGPPVCGGPADGRHTGDCIQNPLRVITPQYGPVWRILIGHRLGQPAGMWPRAHGPRAVFARCLCRFKVMGNSKTFKNEKPCFCPFKLNIPFFKRFFSFTICHYEKYAHPYIDKNWDHN